MIRSCRLTIKSQSFCKYIPLTPRKHRLRSMDKPKADTIFNYSVAGLKITTNRQASDLDERGYSDVAARILFQKAQRAKPFGFEYELTGSADSLRAFIRKDGEEVLIYE